MRGRRLLVWLLYCSGRWSQHLTAKGLDISPVSKPELHPVTLLSTLPRYRTR